MKCLTCNGKKVIRFSVYVPALKKYIKRTIPCSHCNGTGEYQGHNKTDSTEKRG